MYEINEGIGVSQKMLKYQNIESGALAAKLVALVVSFFTAVQML